MGIIKRLFKPKAEMRAIDPSWAALSAWSPQGATVNAAAAENLAVVFACAEIIASSLGSLPLLVMRQTEGGQEEDPDHPLARMHRSGPNALQDWPSLIQSSMASVLLQGNALVEVVRDGAGRLKELRYHPWGNVNPQVLPGGRVVYDLNDPLGLWGPAGSMRRLLPEDVLHLRDRSDDGLLGRSRLSRARGAVQAALEVQDFAVAVHSNRATPSGTLELDGKLSPEAMDALKARIRESYQGVDRAGRVMVLDQGLKWKSISISPEDAELLSSRRFATEEIARLFQVPPPLVGIWDHSSFTNSETAGRWFATHTLRPWCRKLEAALLRACFSTEAQRSYRLEFDLSDFLKGDDKARWEAHQIALANKVLTPNEVRGMEGWNPREGGDTWGDEGKSK